MVALVCVLAFVVVVLTVLVAGLLRSHADILKALHDLGAGVGDPAASGDGGLHGGAAGTGAGAGLHGTGSAAVPVPLRLGPPLPGERDSVSTPPVTGVTPRGDALTLAVGTTGHLTLLAFLSSGCAACAEFWAAARDPAGYGLPADVRLVAVTKGPELEVPGEVRSRAGETVLTVMSTAAWEDYEVPGSPFFVLVDGRQSRRIGEGVAQGFTQVVELVRRAQSDLRPFGAPSTTLNGPQRESDNDRRLAQAGIGPGDPSLYPRTLADIMAPAAGAAAADASAPADPPS